jgi:hypothetical protein
MVHHWCFHQSWTLLISWMPFNPNWPLRRPCSNNSSATHSNRTPTRFRQHYITTFWRWISRFPLVATLTHKDQIPQHTTSSWLSLASMVLKWWIGFFRSKHSIFTTHYISRLLLTNRVIPYVYIKELNAITKAVLKWRQRQYLLRHFYVIRTNHKSICELLHWVIQTLTPDQQV